MDFYSNFGRNIAQRQRYGSWHGLSTADAHGRRRETQNGETSGTRIDVAPSAPWERPPQTPRPRSAMNRPTVSYPELAPPSSFSPYPHTRVHSIMAPIPSRSRPCTCFPGDAQQRPNQRPIPSTYRDRIRPSTAPANPTRGTKRISRFDAWTRFLAYEACFQVCMEAAIQEAGEAEALMRDNCLLLKRALQVNDLLLKGDAAAMDHEYSTAPFIMWEDDSRVDDPNRMLSLGLGETQAIGEWSPPSHPAPRKENESRRVTRVRFDRLIVHPPILSMTEKCHKQRYNGEDYPTATSIRYGDGDALGGFFHALVDSQGRPVSFMHGNELVIIPDDDMNAWIAVDAFIHDSCIASGSLSLEQLNTIDKKTKGIQRRPPKPKTGCFRFFKPSHDKLNDQTTSPAIDDDELISRGVGLHQNKGDPASASSFFPLSTGHRKLHRTGYDQPRSPWPHPFIRHKKNDVLDEIFEVEEVGTCEVELLDKHSVPVGITCLLTLERSTVECGGQHLESYLPSHRNPLPRGIATEKDAQPKPSLGYVRVNSYTAYEYLLGCLLRIEECGPQKLFVQGPWEWLLREFAQTFGIRNGFAHLTHIKWILRPDVRSSTTLCLETLHHKLVCILQERDGVGLQENDSAALKLASEQIKELLAMVFESYYALNDAAPRGVYDGISGPDIQDYPPSALIPALALLSIPTSGLGSLKMQIKDTCIRSDLLESIDSSTNPSWLVERFKVASKKKYDKLQSSVDTEGNGMDETNRFRIYKGMEQLTLGIKRELECDFRIQSCNILPHFINLPLLAAKVFCKLLMEKVEIILGQIPPTEPSKESTDMLVGLGRLQEYLVTSIRHSILVGLYEICAVQELQSLTNSEDETGAVIDIIGRFRPFVSDWLLSSQDRLTVQCQQLQDQMDAPRVHGVGTVKCAASPMVSEMLMLMEMEMSIFERVVCFWKTFGIQLESVICRALRVVISTISYRSGMRQGTSVSFSPAIHQYSPNEAEGRARSFHFSPAKTPNRQPTWQWHRDQNSLQSSQTGIEPREAVLLNSLRLILGTVPDLEQKLKQWCLCSNYEDREDEGMGRPGIGDQFAQVVKELRTEYSTATVFCCGRMVHDITQNPQNMIGNLILQTGHLSDIPVEERMQSLFSTLLVLCSELEKSVDTRVFVTLTRGLWEHLSEDLYIFVENLQEGHDFQDAWKCRQHAQSVARSLNDWFRGTLTNTVGHNLTEKDLDLPLHASMTQKLLAENSTIVNMAYAVF